MLRLLAFAGVAGAGILFSIIVRASPPKDADSFTEIFRKHGARYGVDPLLLRAIATVESSLNPDAVNTADRYSVGLMQIFYRPSNPNDLNSRPSNRFDIAGWSEATFDKLKDPDFNVMLGAQILSWNIRNFGYPRGIAVYNSWDQRRSPLNGPFKNQAYVNKVIAAYKRIAA